MKKLLFLFAILVFGHEAFAQDGATAQPFNIGETLEFQSIVLAETRRINVYLPNDYHPDSAKTYPVIYLLDGSVDEDFIHIAGLVQFGSFSWINLIPESIVVGIANVDRKRDFTFPTSIENDKKDFPTTGASARFIDFIASELQPLVEKRYKTSAPKTIIGQSLGGLLATEILFKKPELFDKYIIVSPSLWWDAESMLKLTPAPYSTKKSIYVGVGEEGKVMKRDAKALYKKLKRGSGGNTSLYYGFFPKQDHGDVLHLAVYAAFEKVFGK